MSAGILIHSIVYTAQCTHSVASNLPIKLWLLGDCKQILRTCTHMLLLLGMVR